jgi:hypothetical protein
LSKLRIQFCYPFKYFKAAAAASTRAPAIKTFFVVNQAFMR